MVADVYCVHRDVTARSEQSAQAAGERAERDSREQEGARRIRRPRRVRHSHGLGGKPRRVDVVLAGCRPDRRRFVRHERHSAHLHQCLCRGDEQLFHDRGHHGRRRPHVRHQELPAELVQRHHRRWARPPAPSRPVAAPRPSRSPPPWTPSPSPTLPSSSPDHRLQKRNNHEQEGACCVRWPCRVRHSRRRPRPASAG